MKKKVTPCILIQMIICFHVDTNTHTHTHTRWALGGNAVPPCVAYVCMNAVNDYVYVCVCVCKRQYEFRISCFSCYMCKVCMRVCVQLGL